MEQIFIVASFRLDEGMAKETPNVFAELNIIVNLHSEGGILEIAVVSETVNRASAPEERRKKGWIFYQKVTNHGWGEIVRNIENPTY